MKNYFDEAKFKTLIQSTTFAAGGLLNPQQADRFIDLVVDQQVLLKLCDVRRMVTNSIELDRIGMQARQMRKHNAGVAGSSANITTDKRTLTLTEAKIWFELDIRTLRRLTIEGDGKDIEGALLRHIMEMAANAYGNDVEDLGVNGDDDLDSSAFPFQSITDGWLKIAKEDGHTFDLVGETDYLGTVFANILSLLPERYRARQADFTYFTTPTIRDNYIKQIVATGTAGSLPYLVGNLAPTYMGIPVVGVPSFPSGHIMLTPPKNLAFGIDANGIERDFDKKVVERVIQSVIIAPIGYQISNEDAVVTAWNATEPEPDPA
jgi:hypothetical protein